MPLIEGFGDQPATPNSTKSRDRSQELVSWIMERVDDWRDARDQAYQTLWGEYYRLWRGRHTDADKSRSSERSKLVGPALSQALEMTVAELEEATFGRENWIDLVITETGDMPEDFDPSSLQRQFLEDLEKDKVPNGVADAYLNGGLWGTLAAKVVVRLEQQRKIVTERDPVTGRYSRKVEVSPKVSVGIVPIPVEELIPDPDATSVEEGLGIIHECEKSRAWLLTQPWGKSYAARGDSSNPEALNANLERKDPEDSALSTEAGSVLVTEWHGLVPLRLLEEANGKDRSRKENPVPGDVSAADPLADAIVNLNEALGELDGDGEMVEAIVTILDKTYLAQAVRNPFLMQDRSIVCAQFERVPGRFWGRGVMEKGYNPQKAMDAELRARMDALALITYPMVALDQTALPRNFDMRVYPGKAWLTNGNPKEAIMPFAFPGLDQATFAQTAEMERMVQMGTGAMDTATPLEGNRRNETLGGTSMIASTFVKRAKRALRGITKNFTEPLVRKILWRRLQYDFQRYPVAVDFRIVGSLGIVARELEQSQLTQLLSLVEQGSSTSRLIVKAIFDNSNSPYKGELEQALAEDSQPNPMMQKVQQLQIQAAEMDLQNKQLENAKIATQLREIQAKTMLTMAQVQTEIQKPGEMDAKVQQEFARLQIELGELAEFSRQNDIATLKTVGDIQAKAQGGTNASGSKTTDG